MGRGAFEPDDVLREALPGTLLKPARRPARLRKQLPGLYLTSDERFMIRRTRTRNGFSGREWVIDVASGGPGLEKNQAVLRAASIDIDQRAFPTLKLALAALEAALAS